VYLYLDDEKTKVAFSIEEKMDAHALHSDDAKEYFNKLLVEELKVDNDLTEEEIIEYINVIEEAVGLYDE